MGAGIRTDVLFSSALNTRGGRALFTIFLIGLARNNPDADVFYTTPHDGRYLSRFRINGPGLDDIVLESTDDPKKALQFMFADEALEYWQQVHPFVPIRSDGKPNRPLTAFHALINDENESERIRNA